VNGFHVNPAGVFRLCGALCHPESVYDLRKGSLSNAWHDFVPRVRHMSSERIELLETCQECPLINLCMWCPGHAHLETGQLDALVPYFCEVAHARAKALGKEQTFLSPRQANMPRTSSEPTLRVRALQPRHYDDNSSL
jgi:radical SAM protein with 4Fe4S-binding SPASM domain